jgi:hypothetical protein
VIGMLNLVICYNHWTLGVMLHSGKCGTAVTSINGVFFGIVALRLALERDWTGL